jgi:hypothetical protein
MARTLRMGDHDGCRTNGVEVQDEDLMGSRRCYVCRPRVAGAGAGVDAGCFRYAKWREESRAVRLGLAVGKNTNWSKWGN